MKLTPARSSGQPDNADTLQVSAFRRADEDAPQIGIDDDDDDSGRRLSALEQTRALVAVENGTEPVAESVEDEDDGGQGFVTGKLPFTLPSRDAGTRRLALQLYRENPHLSAKHRFRTVRYAHLVRLIERVAARLNASGPFRADDDSKRALVDLARLSSEARSLEDGLGLVPPVTAEKDAEPFKFTLEIAAAYERSETVTPKVIEQGNEERDDDAPTPDIITEAQGPESTPEPPLTGRRREFLAMEVSFIEAAFADD